MSGTTTAGGTPARTLDLNKLRQDLRAKRGKARGRDAAQDLATALARFRRDPAVVPVLRAFEAGAPIALTPAIELLLTSRLEVDPAALADATETEAPAAPAGSVVGTAATGTLTLGANTGTASIVIPGAVLTAPSPGYWAEVALQGLDAGSGTAFSAMAHVLVKRPSGNAAAAVAVTNRFGTEFGATGGAGVSVAVAVACAADGSTATLTLTNSAAAAREVIYSVQRRAGG